MRKLSSSTLPWPTDWSQLFGSVRPLIVEIGFGRGQFLYHLADTRPDASIVGLEISNRCLTSAERTIERRGLDNLRVVHSTAETALHHLMEPGTVCEFHINFPDPWFKQQHSRRRLMQRPVVNALVNRLRPGGMLYLATDILAYAEMSHKLLGETPGLDNIVVKSWVTAMPGRIVTKYEARAQQEGRECYYFAYRRNELRAPTIPVIKEMDMPHIVFSSPLDLNDILAAYTPIEQRIDDMHISLLYAYRGENRLLFETYISEPTIDQRVAILLIHRDDGEYTLKLGTLGLPRPTEGVHRALGLLGDWVVSLHAETRISKRTLRG
jgi:tRNA (guanine-N7-)-methyltransferase